MESKLPSRQAGPPDHHDDKVDSDQQDVIKELSRSTGYMENFGTGTGPYSSTWTENWATIERWTMDVAAARDVACRGVSAQ